MEIKKSILKRVLVSLIIILVIGMSLWGLKPKPKSITVNDDLNKKILYSYMKQKFDFIPKNIKEESKEYVLTINSKTRDKNTQLEGRISKLDNKNNFEKEKDFKINKKNEIAFNGSYTPLSMEGDFMKIRDNLSVPDYTVITSDKGRFKCFLEDIESVQKPINLSEKSDNIPEYLLKDFHNKGLIFSVKTSSPLLIANTPNDIYTATISLSLNADGTPMGSTTWEKSENYNSELISYFNKNKMIKDDSKNILNKVLKNHTEMNQEVDNWYSDSDSDYDYKFSSSIGGDSTEIGIKGTTVYIIDSTLNKYSFGYQKASFIDTKKLTQDYTNQLWKNS